MVEEGGEGAMGVANGNTRNTDSNVVSYKETTTKNETE